MIEFTRMEVDVYLILLSLLFFVVALVYSSVGMGGGSSYTALMVIFGFNTLVIPMVSLSLNLIVTLIGSYNFIRHRQLRIKMLIPFLLTSIPMAYWGGSLRISEEIFYIILLGSLIFVAIRIYFWKNLSFKLQLNHSNQLILSLAIGASIGLVSGIVGIGGGIYLIPLIIILNLGTPQEAAACGTVFIWCNSFIGLTARLQYNYVDITDYFPLILSVVLGGYLGSYLGSAKFPSRLIEKTIGTVVLIAILFLIRGLLP